MTPNVMALLGGVALVFVVLGCWRPALAFGVAVAVAPWQELMVDVGLRLTLHTLSILGLIAAFMFHVRGQWRGHLLHRLWWPLAALLVWALAWSLFQLPQHNSAQVAGGLMRSPSIRPMIQVASFALTLFPVLVAPFVLRSYEDLAHLGRIFLVSVTLLVLLGWWQLFIANSTGHNPLPMGITNAWLGGMNGITRDALDLGPNSAKIYRMNSLGGEPRYLAQSITTALLLMQIGWLSRVLLFSKFSVLLFGVLFAALLATMSMSGLYLWIVGTLVLLFYFLRHGLSIGRYERGVFLAVGIALCLLGAWVSQRPSQWNGLLDVMTYLIHRVIGRGLIADFDAVVLDFLKTEPIYLWFGVGLGNVHLHADAYLSPYLREFAGGTSFVADSGWLRLLSELGLLGLGLFLVWCRQIWVALRDLKAHPVWGGAVVVLMPVFLVGVVGYLARGTTYAPVAFMLFAAAVSPVFAAGRRV